MKLFGKIIKFILISLLIIVILAVILLVILYIRMKDTTNNTNPEIIERNISLDDALSKQMALALDKTREDGKVEIALSEYDLNEIAYAVSRKIPSSSNFEVLSCYMELDDENYYLNVPLKVFGQQTLVRGKLSLDIDQQKFSIGLKEVGIGKFKINSIFMNGVLSFFKSSLKEIGLETSFKNDSLNVSITRLKIRDLLNDSLEENEYKDLIIALYNIFFIDNACFDFKVNNPNDIKLIVDFSMFEGSSTTELDGIKNDVKTLLDNNTLKLADTAIAVNYFAAGYSHMSEESQKKADTALAASFDPVTLKSNSGYINRTPSSMSEIFISQAATASVKGINITDKNLTTIFTNLTLLGIGAGFATYDTHLVSYIVLDQFEAFINDDFLRLSLRININGYVINISCDFNVPEKDALSLNATLVDMTIGTKSIGDNKDKLFNFVANLISEEEDWIERGEEPNTLVFNFKSFFEDSSILSMLLESSPHPITKLYSNSNPSTGGFINIKLM